MSVKLQDQFTNFYAIAAFCSIVMSSKEDQERGKPPDTAGDTASQLASPEVEVAFRLLDLFSEAEFANEQASKHRPTCS